MRNFSLTAVYGAAEHGAVCRPVKEGAHFAPKQGLHFRLSFLVASFSYAILLGANIVPDDR